VSRKRHGGASIKFNQRARENYVEFVVHLSRSFPFYSRWILSLLSMELDGSSHANVSLCLAIIAINTSPYHGKRKGGDRISLEKRDREGLVARPIIFTRVFNAGRDVSPASIVLDRTDSFLRQREATASEERVSRFHLERNEQQTAFRRSCRKFRRYPGSVDSERGANASAASGVTRKSARKS